MTATATDPEAAPRFPPNHFPRGWFQVAYADELAPEAVLPLRYFGRDLVLWRDAEGAPRLMDAHCLHLGAHLGHGGRVEGTGIRCPFHNWKYDGTGTCVDVPYSDTVHRNVRLRRYPVLERNGLIMCWWSATGAEPAWELPVLPEYGSDDWSDYRRHEWRVQTHWQEMVENAADTSHFRYLHGAAEVPVIDKFDADGPVLRCLALHVLTTSDGPRPGSIDTLMYGPGWGTVRFIIDGIAETLFAQALTPVDHGRLHVRFSFLAKGRGARRGLSDGLALEVVKQINADVPIWEHKLYRPRPLLARGDGPVHAFRRWAEQFDESAATADRAEVTEA